jgi:hypothetical protein
VDEEIRKERQQAEYMARAAAWDAEKASARLVKVCCPDGDIAVVVHNI